MKHLALEKECRPTQIDFFLKIILPVSKHENTCTAAAAAIARVLQSSTGLWLSRFST